MTRIEKAVKIVSDLYDFYRKIPKVSNQSPMRDEQPNRAAGDLSPPAPTPNDVDLRKIPLPSTVTPAKAGVQKSSKSRRGGTGFRLSPE